MTNDDLYELVNARCAALFDSIGKTIEIRVEGGTEKTRKYLQALHDNAAELIALAEWALEWKPRVDKIEGILDGADDDE